jgi:hypothetical protein
MFLRFNNLFYPASDVTLGTPSSEMGKEEMIEFLKDDEEIEKIPLKEDDKKDEKDKIKDKEKTKEDEIKAEDEKDKDEEKDEGEEELKEIEEELEEPPEEKLELMAPARRRDILKKYPTLFKDFPYLENAYYREQQFTEIFPTPADAKDALEAKDTLNKFETDLDSGNIENVLKAVKSASPKSFNKVVDNYLVTLGKIDPGAHQHVIGNIIKHTVMAMVAEGKRKGNDELNEAAEKIYEFVFGTSDFKPPSNLNREESDKEESENNKLKEERQAFTKQKFEAANNDLDTRINNSIKKTIEANIDPKTSMSDYVRRNASRDAMDTLTDLIEKDTRFKTLIDRLWEKAFESNFSQNSLDNIKSAYFSKARTLLPSVIKKARNEALRGMGKRVREDESDSTPEKESKEDKEPSRSHRTSDKNTEKGKVPKGMSTLEFLSQD